LPVRRKDGEIARRDKNFFAVAQRELTNKENRPVVDWTILPSQS
jgi:hypothetical protein